MTTYSVIHTDKFYEHLWHLFSQAIQTIGHDRYHQLGVLTVLSSIAVKDDDRPPQKECQSFIYGLSAVIYCFVGEWDRAEKFRQSSLAIDPNDFLLKVATAYLAFHDWEVSDKSESYNMALQACLSAIEAFPSSDKDIGSLTDQDTRIFAFLILSLLTIIIEMGIRHQRIHDILLNSSYGNDVDNTEPLDPDTDQIKTHAREAISLLL